MTHEKLRAALALLPELKKNLCDYITGRSAVYDGPTLKQTGYIIAALEEAAAPDSPVMADRCKMAWKQGFCYGDPEYYPPPDAAAPLMADRREVLPEWVRFEFEKRLKWADGDGMALVEVNTEALRAALNPSKPGA